MFGIDVVDNVSRDLDLNLLVAFEALADTRSVSLSAARLGLRQPAMSAALARLRRALGDELFVRARGAMLPTPRALALAPGVSRALADLRQTLRSETRFDPRTTARTFYIASTDYTSFVIAPPLQRDVAVSAPKVDLRFVGYDKDDIPELVDRGAIDLAFGTFRPPPARAVHQKLCAERFVGLARKGHPLLRRRKIDVASWAAASHALVSVRRDARGAVDDTLAGHGLSRRVALVLPHMLALPRILETTDLVATVPERIALHSAGASLRPFELPIDVPPWNIEMLWNPASRRDAAHAWLRACALAAGRTA